MQIPLLHQQLILETERLRDMHRSMMMHNSAIPSSEMEVFLQHIRKIYGIALQLGDQNSIQLLNEVQLAHESRVQSPVISQPVAESKPEIIPVPEPIKQVAEVETKKPEPVTEPVAQQQTQQPVAHSQPVYQNGQTVAKKFAEPSTVGGMMAGNDSHKRFSDNIKLPVSDINSAIGINEKFQFINQLFHGDSQKYLQVIHDLNNCPSADAARNSVQQLAESNHWEGIPVAKHFMEVVERKFSA